MRWSPRPMLPPARRYQTSAQSYLAAGSEIAGEAAAGLAAAYIALKANSGASSAELQGYLSHAKQLYSFANSAQGSYQDLTDECLAQHGVRWLCYYVASFHVFT